MRSNVTACTLKRYLPYLLLLIGAFATYEFLRNVTMTEEPIIIVLTPTYRRPERLADMTRSIELSTD